MCTQVGSRESNQIYSKGIAGYLIHGPYISVKPGKYKVTLYGTMGRIYSNKIIFEVAAKSGRIIISTISPIIPVKSDWNFTIDFEVPSPGYIDLEFRVLVDEKVELTVDQLMVCPQTSGATHINELEDLFLNYFTKARIKKSPSSEPKLFIVYVPNFAFLICGLIVFWIPLAIRP